MGKKVELWEDRIEVPQGDKKHYFKDGPVKASVDAAGNLSVTTGPEQGMGVYDKRELYLTIEGPDFASLIQCRPDDGPRVRVLAAKIRSQGSSSTGCGYSSSCSSSAP